MYVRTPVSPRRSNVVASRRMSTGDFPPTLIPRSSATYVPATLSCSRLDRVSLRHLPWHQATWYQGVSGQTGRADGRSDDDRASPGGGLRHLAGGLRERGGSAPAVRLLRRRGAGRPE